MARLSVLAALVLALVAVLALPGTGHAGSEPCFGVSSSAANNQVGYTFTCDMEPFGGSYTLSADRAITAFTNPKGFTCTQASTDSIKCTFGGESTAKWSGGITLQGGSGCGTANRVTLDVTDSAGAIGGLSQPCIPQLSKISPSTVTGPTKQCFTMTVSNGTTKISGAIVAISTLKKGRTGSNGTVKLCASIPKTPTSIKGSIAPFNECGLVNFKQPTAYRCDLGVTMYAPGWGSGTGSITVNPPK